MNQNLRPYIDGMAQWTLGLPIAWLKNCAMPLALIVCLLPHRLFQYTFMELRDLWQLYFPGVLYPDFTIL